MMPVPVLPESAPFTPSQRAWLNGFFAGLLGADRDSLPLTPDGAMAPSGPNGQDALASGASSSGSLGAGLFGGEPSSTWSDAAPGGPALESAPAGEEEYPWHDPTLSIAERMSQADGKPYPLRLMAAMAQLDCGSCGYLCRTYADAIASGAETDLNKCIPGGKATARQLKDLAAAKDLAPAAATQPAAPSLPQANRASPPPGGAAGGAAWNGVEPLRVAAVTAHQETVYDRRNPYPARILEVRPLNRDGSAKDVRFVSLDLSGSGLVYEAGDSLGVYPANCLELVDEILGLLGATGEEPVITPEGWVVPARIALEKAYVITECSDDLVALLAGCAVHPEEARQLAAMARGDGEAMLGTDLLQMLKAFPSARALVRELAPTLSPLRPRLYSISSSPRAYPNEVHLTVGVVRYTLEGCDRLRKGVASTFLAERMAPGHKVAAFVQPSHGFRPPEDDDRPMIMVGPGTGIAPFRAFLQERAARGARGRNWLFFGDQRRACDFLYQEEMEAHLAGGLMARLDLAFSRDQAEKVYVQHRMLERGAEIWDWLQDGAYVYVCGDAQRMARDVDAALRQIIARHGGRSDADAKAYLAGLTQERRYQRDVY